MADARILNASTSIGAAEVVGRMTLRIHQHQAMSKSTADPDIEALKIYGSKWASSDRFQLFALRHILPITDFAPSDLVRLVQLQRLNPGEFLSSVLVRFCAFIFSGFA